MKILFIKTGNEKTIKAWDENFNYKFIDINNLESIKQLNIELFFNNTQKYNQVSLFKTGKNKFSKSKFKRHINAHNQNYRYNINTNKKTNIVTESSFIFNSDGSFKIYQLCASKNEKKIKTELFYEGNWIAKKLEKGFLLEMSGYISGYFSENNKKYINSEFYNLKATFIDNKLIFKNLLNNFNIDFPNSSLISINELAQNIIVDMPYSTTKNFTGLKLYPCNKCYLRYKVAMDLLKANNMFNKLNYKIKIFDCYRPFFVQAIMFKKFPISGYVADSIWGSIHNRAGAVDLTITDNAGNELNMGTKFDELSYKSNHNYIYFSDTILKNRRFLKKIMMENNFVPINGEWWHYNHINAREYSKLNDNFPCQN
ncbi:MAG: M15 family metallopeptidase [Bacteroidales bacterium]|nr:M15 family metallopeptidase [Bacteroidales bacterium]